MRASPRAGVFIQGSILLIASCAVSAQRPEPGEPTGADWRAQESGILANHVQLTSPEDFIKAGEAYFDPDAAWVVFQAIPRPKDGSEPDEHYSMYVARLLRDSDGRVAGMDEPRHISPPNSANTCGFFHPQEPWRVIFGSTLVPPSDDQPAGYQRDSSRYKWQFPHEMEVVEVTLPEIAREWSARTGEDADIPHRQTLGAMWGRPGYDAECAYSPNGRYIVHTQVDPETGDGDLHLFDTRTGAHTALVEAEGYDGGPFFSPDGMTITYRSDRRGNNLLQVFVADLKFNDRGIPIGIESERQVTDNAHVNWAPYWHPSGLFLVYSTSEVGHHNYEVFAAEAPVGGSAGRKGPDELSKRRITYAPGFDGLPVFSDDGALMMWTSQRGGTHGDEERPSSQVWVAEVVSVDPRTTE